MKPLANDGQVLEVKNDPNLSEVPSSIRKSRYSINQVAIGKKEVCCFG
ncbi:hypothetical protein J2T09_003429 [Neorhizobium huautlense]|uniref:Uncharacterized protein n=1 Tax=Neorhizobium huautlense TaxID=67774 RepID=A0ABT9PW82_9HYPH|nr:hypothetical protein [Neorhizobium huautlense]